MIIVKRTAGDVFINEKTVQSVMHDKQSKSVLIKDVEGKQSDAFYEVESVGYTNDAQPTQWMDESSEIQRLKSEYEKLKKDYDQMLELSRFMREWFFIYQNAFYDIKNAVLRSKNGSKCEDLVIESLIDVAEKKYQESQKRFEEVRAKTKEL
ncbi:MAG: hypothetical protein U0L52_05530 [Bacteroidaceae bacterium]|nr:hypothetical protein [Bacteroidaceae bacterium]